MISITAAAAIPPAAIAAGPIAGVTIAPHLAAFHRPKFAASNWTIGAAATIVAAPFDAETSASPAIGSAPLPVFPPASVQDQPILAPMDAFLPQFQCLAVLVKL